MLNKLNKLVEKIFTKEIEKKAIREGFGEGLVLAGEENKDVVVLTADLGESTKTTFFKEKFPERFFEVGVAEQALATVGAGMALYGKIPFITSFSIFSPGRNWEQIRTTIALNNTGVKIIGSHAGLNTGADGSSHQALEDIALMRVVPRMIVLVPCDALEAKKATLEIARIKKPVYLRLAREATPVFTTDSTPFEIGKAEVFWESKSPQAAIIACGALVYEALKAAKELEKNKIESLVLNCPTIKPLDGQAIIRAAKISGAVLTVEEHQIAGGLGGAVSELLANNCPVPMEFVGMKDKFGESGRAKELWQKYNLDKTGIVSAFKRLLRKKNS